MSSVVPSPPTVLVHTLHRVRRRHRTRFVAEAPATPSRQPARVAVMLALAHKMRAAIESGDAHDYVGIAQRLGFTRARITHLVDLTLLAPAIQEHLLTLVAVDGVEPITERALRQVVRHRSWDEQWARWCMVTDSKLGAESNLRG
ncbi:MAG: hypothetical protein ACTHU0_24945 [Kofleriaceae bacterium]